MPAPAEHHQRTRRAPRQRIAIAQNALDHQAARVFLDSGTEAQPRVLDPLAHGRGTNPVPRADRGADPARERGRKRYLANKKGVGSRPCRDALEWAVQWLDPGRAGRSAPHADPLWRSRLLPRRTRPGGPARRDRAREEQTPPKSSRDFALSANFAVGQAELSASGGGLRRAVELDKRRFWAWFGLGYCLFEQGRYLEAAGNFMVCTALEPNFAWPYMNQGLALAHAGRLNEALTAYNQALQHNPRFAEALVNRALVQLELDTLTGAESDLRRAITLDRKGRAMSWLPWAKGSPASAAASRPSGCTPACSRPTPITQGSGSPVPCSGSRPTRRGVGSTSNTCWMQLAQCSARRLRHGSARPGGPTRSQALAYANQAFDADPSLSDGCSS